MTELDDSPPARIAREMESISKEQAKQEQVVRPLPKSEQNLGGRPPNPKFQLEPKEFDLIKWVAERKHIKDPGEFAKRIVMNYCKTFYLEQKKLAEERAKNKEMEKELETEEIIKEIEEDGGIDKQRKYIRDHRKKKDPDAPPVMEGQIDPGEEEEIENEL